ncbi:MAG: hypothetical protein U0807_03530 [Candidatus Binatia bacterium]
MPPPHPRDRIAALLPPCFFGAAVLFFTVGLALAPFVLPDLLAHFYQAHVLALTHTFTLGWLSMAMVGVLYRYVPAITKRHVPHPRLALVQYGTFVLGVATLIVQFWRGDWVVATAAAGVLVVSVALLCANLWPLLWSAPRHGVAEVGILAATALFFSAAVLGTLLAADKTWPFLGGSLLTNLGAHVHLAAVGWVGLTLCALSFRFLPAFLLPTLDASDPARRLVLLLATEVVLLVGTLLLRSRLAAVVGIALAVGLGTYVVLVLEVIRTHRMPIDWTGRHAIASAVWCVVAVAAGVALALIGAETETGVHLTAAYAAAGLLGWMSNMVIGVSYKLFPGFVAAARTERGRRVVPMGVLGVRAPLQAVVCVLFNIGVAVTAGGLLLGTWGIALPGTLLLAAGGLAYAAGTSRTIAFAFTDPRRPWSPLEVLP